MSEKIPGSMVGCCLVDRVLFLSFMLLRYPKKQVVRFGFMVAAVMTKMGDTSEHHYSKHLLK
jgi:hypothetical protein